MLHGAIGAALTPLTGGGSTIDEAAIAPYVDFLASHGLDGVLVLGTTGEGVLFDLDERREILELFMEAAGARLQVAAHCGAQSTHDTTMLAEHAALVGADAVAVIAPPYFALDPDELFEHFAAAAAACAPLPFYIYEFAARSGYAIPLEVIARLRDEASNLAGLKVSDTPWEKFEPYLVEGLDIFVGPEALIPQGLGGGAVGAVSGLASCFPDAVVPLVREPTPEAGARAGALRASLQRLPFHAAAKMVLGLRGVPVRGAVRPPLRGLSEHERSEVERIVAEWHA
jgi:dihydrodipicolinate synthase/N-acetylneuraminate lyase